MLEVPTLVAAATDGKDPELVIAPFAALRNRLDEFETAIYRGIRPDERDPRTVDRGPLRPLAYESGSADRTTCLQRRVGFYWARASITSAREGEFERSGRNP